MKRSLLIALLSVFVSGCLLSTATYAPHGEITTHTSISAQAYVNRKRPPRTTTTTTTVPSTTTTPPVGFPNADNTGPTGPLTLWTGSLDFYADNLVIENYEFQLPGRGIYVAGDNTTFRNCKFVFNGALDEDFTMAQLNDSALGTVFDHVEFDGNLKVARAISGNPVTVASSELHDVGNGVETESSLDYPMIVKDSYLHDITEAVGSDWHADGIQTPMSADGMQIVHNTIRPRNPSTSSTNMQGTQTDPATNVLIDSNLMSGGAFTVYAGWGSNYRVTNNHFSIWEFPKVGFYGLWYFDPGQDGDVLRTGNIIEETGAPANDNNF